ncbi:hypothetical protein J6590_085434 [Homalodisca vitripennis]|nr:hypothetical protein J6590_085434 [Homalodisca vitripennis]
MVGTAGTHPFATPPRSPRISHYFLSTTSVHDITISCSTTPKYGKTISMRRTYSLAATLHFGDEDKGMQHFKSSERRGTVIRNLNSIVQ